MQGSEIDYIVGMFGEEVRNSNGIKLIELMQQSELVLWNNREFCTEPEWTRVMPTLNQKSIVDYIASTKDLMNCYSPVNIDHTDIGISDHLLVWVELGKTRRVRYNKRKRIIFQWRVDGLSNKEIKSKYQEALEDEVQPFVDKLNSLKESTVTGRERVSIALREWEKVVVEIAKKEVGEKRIVCGRSVKWWDDELRKMVRDRRACHRQVLEGNINAWEDYCEKRKLLKNRIREKRKLLNDSYMQKVNTSYRKSKREFWKFVRSRQVKDNKKNIDSLKDQKHSCSVSETKQKVRVLKDHYENLGKEKHIPAFDNDWKLHVQTKLREFESLSEQSEFINLLDEILMKPRFSL